MTWISSVDSMTEEAYWEPVPSGRAPSNKKFDRALFEYIHGPNRITAKTAYRLFAFPDEEREQPEPNDALWNHTLAMLSGEEQDIIDAAANLQMIFEFADGTSQKHIVKDKNGNR